MWRVISNIVEMLVYASVYLIIILIIVKVVGPTISADFEKKISDEGNLGYSLICAAICIGMAMLLSSIIR